ncbi:MAG: hypothetical protein QGG40_04490, partial [Myxococcota bacterium]|nr:hypothetical protein [Myxococcota bacterium]
IQPFLNQAGENTAGSIRNFFERDHLVEVTNTGFIVLKARMTENPVNTWILLTLGLAVIVSCVSVIGLALTQL